MDPIASNRRTFLKGALAGGAALTLGRESAWASAAAPTPTGMPKAGKIGDFKISLAEWSLHTALKAKDAAITNLDFPRIAREDFGIDAVEFVNQFFADKAEDSAYLKDLKKRADDQGVACVLIMIDKEGDLSAKESKARMEVVENHKRWVDAAAALGCHAIRVNTGNNYGPTDIGAVAEACSALAEHGAKNRIQVICENHGGPSSNPDALLALIKAVGSDSFGTLPDFGNFPKDPDGSYAIDIYEAIARLMPHAKGVSAKSYDFGPDGRESKLDYPRILKIVTDAGYTGHVGIEYEGKTLGESEGIRATKTLLESLRGSMYQPA